MNCYDTLRSLAAPAASGGQRGIYAVCSMHPLVVDAALRKAAASGARLLIETTSNQVNQFGGYTGMTPAAFMRRAAARMRSLGVPSESLVYGSDHAGPFPWRAEPAAAAMEKARTLVQQCVQAGYLKIHLDATMHLADDTGDRAHPLDPHVGARRTAELCAAAEEAWRQVRRQEPAVPQPLYVIGSDVPAPGGTESGAAAPEVTRPDDLRSTIEITREAFHDSRLQDAWTRVIAVVVQPAVEHGESIIHRYDRENVRALVEARKSVPGVVFEAHATDYQAPRALREMVDDGFAILKVGPSLSGAVREALFLLDHVEEALAGTHPGWSRSRVPAALDSAMLANPSHWKAYYQGDAARQAFSRKFALSDRCRYYWEIPSVKAEVERLIANLRSTEIPAGLLSQYFPRQFLRIQNGSLAPDPEGIIGAQVDEVLDWYAAAVGG